MKEIGKIFENEMTRRQLFKRTFYTASVLSSGLSLETNYRIHQVNDSLQNLSKIINDDPTPGLLQKQRELRLDKLTLILNSFSKIAFGAASLGIAKAIEPTKLD